MRLSYPIFRLQNYPQATGTRPNITQRTWEPPRNIIRSPEVHGHLAQVLSILCVTEARKHLNYIYH